MNQSKNKAGLLRTYFAIDLFKSFDNFNIQYVVLRGHEQFPFYSNDIDIGIHKKDASRALTILREIASSSKSLITVELTRLGVSKLTVSNPKEILKLDIWFDFNYLGFRYIDSNRLFQYRRRSNSIWIPRPDYELAISYLKELLHNNTIRNDKIKILREKSSLHTHEAFLDYFPKNIANRFTSSIQLNSDNLLGLSIRAKVHLIYRNIKHRGFHTTSKSLFRFILIRLLRSKDIYISISIPS